VQVISGTSVITFGARGTEGRACLFGTDRDRGVGHLGSAVGSGPTATAVSACEFRASARAARTQQGDVHANRGRVHRQQGHSRVDMVTCWWRRRSGASDIRHE
jgi:hypothetical protein